MVEEATHLAIILLDASGRIELWNSGAQRIFGHSSDEVAARHFEILFLPRDRENAIPARELARALEEGRGDDTRWHVRRDGRRIFVDGLTIPLWNENGSLRGFAKFARDITERHETERRLAAQLALTRILGEDEPVDVTARRIMQTICENLDWDIGALWRVRDGEIESVDFWHAPHVNGALARELCSGHRLPLGEGLPGSVATQTEAVWVFDFRDEHRFPRAPIASRAGMRGAFAFPIIASGEVVGVMEFFSGTEREPEQALLPVMTLIGAQIGDFILRRKTIDALRRSEELYRLVSETAHDAIFTIDEHSVITFCNAAVERLFGYRPEEMVGQSLEIIIPERLRESHRNGIERFLRTRKRRVPWTGLELPALHRDGHEVPCEISFGEWTSGSRTIFTGFARDSTERRKALEQEKRARAEAEAAREQLERRAEEEASFRRLASALTGAIEMFDVMSEITNRATHVTRADGVYVERVVIAHGAPVVEVVSSFGRGTPPRGLRVAYPGSMSEEVLRAAAPVILTSMEGFGRSMAPYLADSCAGCEVLVTPLVAESEPLGALVLLNSRSSGRRFGDGDIVRARTLGDLASLALRRVRLLEDERAAKERAEAAVRVRDETLGIVSHDLRNPLARISLSVDLLEGADESEQKELVETVRSSARQMERLIQDLLDVARLETGRFSVDRRPLDPVAVIREVCASNEPLAGRKQQTIVCRIDEPLPALRADRERLVQAFGNLLGNAMKFTPERGIISVHAWSTELEVHFSVRDNGPGLSEAELPRLFTPYYQAKKTAHMGAGLGLAIVRGIVEAHGGRVRAENAQGGGALFTFSLPVERELLSC